MAAHMAFMGTKFIDFLKSLKLSQILNFKISYPKPSLHLCEASLKYRTQSVKCFLKYQNSEKKAYCFT